MTAACNISFNQTSHIVNMLVEDQFDEKVDYRHNTERAVVMAMLAVLFFLVENILPQSKDLVLGADGGSLWNTQRSFYVATLSLEVMKASGGIFL